MITLDIQVTYIADVDSRKDYGIENEDNDGAYSTNEKLNSLGIATAALALQGRLTSDARSATMGLKISTTMRFIVPVRSLNHWKFLQMHLNTKADNL